MPDDWRSGTNPEQTKNAFGSLEYDRISTDKFTEREKNQCP